MSGTCEILPHADTAGACHHCGTSLTRRQTRWCSKRCSEIAYQNHRWTDARLRALTRDGHQCTAGECSETTTLQVNHIVPRNGAGYDWGCWHHLDNLETLCRAHHVEVTRQQRAAGLIGSPDRQHALMRPCREEDCSRCAPVVNACRAYFSDFEQRPATWSEIRTWVQRDASMQLYGEHPPKRLPLALFDFEATA